jgi:REP-associated tyrosine transposase
MSIKTISFTRRQLPHWQVYGKASFVTFRLRGSLPESVLLKLNAERDAILVQSNNEAELYEFQRYEFKAIEAILDSVKNSENSYLANDNIAPVLMTAFETLEDKYCWRFPSFVIMPNHIHCLCIADKTGKQITLKKILSLFKSFTGKEINKILNRPGRVWVDENFDHWCRIPGKEASVKRYIANNPVKAGLVTNSQNWQWQK